MLDNTHRNSRMYPGSTENDISARDVKMNLCERWNWNIYYDDFIVPNNVSWIAEIMKLLM
jgi:hypothetical protein